MVETTAICRFCHATCGLKVTIEQGRVVGIIGDIDNPVYHGYSCVKGRNYHEFHYDPGPRAAAVAARRGRRPAAGRAPTSALTGIAGELAAHPRRARAALRRDVRRHVQPFLLRRA